MLDDVLHSLLPKYQVLLLKLKNSKIITAQMSHFPNFHTDNNGKVSGANEVLSPKSADERKWRSDSRVASVIERTNNTALNPERFKLIEYWHKNDLKKQLIKKAAFC